CAKAKRQRQMFPARKRSVSGKCFLRESEASAANVSCAKAKRQRQLRQGEKGLEKIISKTLYLSRNTFA
ncbi:hypothetical protein, partial [Lysinibacillus sp. NPDC093216]|uniref:hypothetical protein n=1 Tax=Lysinibacillus sp. NPDC093216 TaxID=3390576 RepID=UPI003CFCE2CC